MKTEIWTCSGRSPDWLKSKNPDAPAVTKRYLVSLKQLAPWLEGRNLADIDRRLVAEIIRERQRAGVTNATIKRDLGALSSILNFAILQGWLETNPVLPKLALVPERRDPILLPSDRDIALVSDDAKFAKAYQAIGEYFSEFSELERELGEAVKVVLHLEGHDAADIVVDFLRYPTNKAGLVRAAATIARKKDGSETSTEWKAKVDETLGKILSHNQSTRVPLSHSHLEPQEDGSVKVTRQGEGRKRSKIWNLKNKADEVRRLSKELRG